MRILLSAFAFAPGVGSEAGGAWRWAFELSKRHDVVVVTDISRRERCEEALCTDAAPSLTVLYYRPRWVHAVPLNSLTAQTLFGIWQAGLPGFVRRLHAERPFDLLHHMSYGVHRQASRLGCVGPPFVFGPVGGAEDAPWRLKTSMPVGEKLREAARAAANWLAVRNPLWRRAVRRAALVIARTEETRRAFPQDMQARVLVAQEIGAPVREVGLASGPPAGGPYELLFIGRLLGWKGVHLAVDALRLLRDRGLDVRLTIVGDGPARRMLARRVERAGLAQAVRFLGQMSQREAFAQYGQAHVFLFPSLHDSGGNVVLEALAAGLPVVCLDLGGPSMFVDSSCDLLVPARLAAGEAPVAAGIASAIERIVESPASWTKLHVGALARAKALSWAKQQARLESAILASLAAR